MSFIQVKVAAAKLHFCNLFFGWFVHLWKNVVNDKGQTDFSLEKRLEELSLIFDKKSDH